MKYYEAMERRKGRGRSTKRVSYEGSRGSDSRVDIQDDLNDILPRFGESWRSTRGVLTAKVRLLQFGGYLNPVSNSLNQSRPP